MYETIVILNPNTTNDVLETKISDWNQLVKEFGAETRRIERWGKKNLAFEVKKFHQGIFVIFHIEGKIDAIVELERRFKIADEVIRYQTVKLTDMEYKASNDLLDNVKSQMHDDTKKIRPESKDDDSDDGDDEDNQDDQDQNSEDSAPMDEDSDTDGDDTQDDLTENDKESA
jgi:small subunit ribosomal protein S6